MKDGELRGVVLERFYDARYKVEWFSLDALVTHLTIDRVVLAHICGQLGEHRLITWKTPGGGVPVGMGKITAQGIDVVEGTARAPITVTGSYSAVLVSGSFSGSNATWNLPLA